MKRRNFEHLALIYEKLFIKSSMAAANGRSYLTVVFTARSSRTCFFYGLWSKRTTQNNSWEVTILRSSPSPASLSSLPSPHPPPRCVSDKFPQVLPDTGLGAETRLSGNIPRIPTQAELTHHLPAFMWCAAAQRGMWRCIRHVFLIKGTSRHTQVSSKKAKLVSPYAINQGHTQIYVNQSLLLNSAVAITCDVCVFYF